MLLSRCQVFYFWYGLITLIGLQASIGVTHAFSSRPFLCALVFETRIGYKCRAEDCFSKTVCGRLLSRVRYLPQTRTRLLLSGYMSTSLYVPSPPPQSFSSLSSTGASAFSAVNSPVSVFIFIHKLISPSYYILSLFYTQCIKCPYTHTNFGL